MILIIDFGSQFNQLIARRIREFQIYCQVEPASIAMNRIKELSPVGIILSGGPSSIYEKKTQKVDSGIFDLGIPILGICYGMHFIVDFFGGTIERSTKGEYGFASLLINSKSEILKGINSDSTIWMSHKDSVKNLPCDFQIDGYTENTKMAAVSNDKRKIYGVQFHPEVEHTKSGKKIIQNFLVTICKCNKNWKMESFINKSITNIRNKVGKNKVILGLSGGVDSSVTALILEKALDPKQLTCIFVDNGFLRKNEAEKLIREFNSYLKCQVKFVKAGNLFIRALSKVTDPESKRKIIGNLFIEVFSNEAKKIKNVKYLAQGTLYPDIIESQSVYGGITSTIKSHHNVGGLPKKMDFELIEPLKYLFKDEVRIIGDKMGLDHNIIWRQPFPGPGLAIRIIGEVTPKKIFLVKEADSILQEEIKAYGLYKKLWQSFVVFLPVKSVGVMGDKRTYDNIIAIRAVTSSDAMTADWARLPYDLLARISNRIINEVLGVNRVVYDISSKPPSTIEFE